MLTTHRKFSPRKPESINYYTCYACGEIFQSNQRFTAETYLYNHIQQVHKNKYVEDIFSPDDEETYPQEYVEEFLKFLPD